MAGRGTGGDGRLTNPPGRVRWVGWDELDRWRGDYRNRGPGPARFARPAAASEAAPVADSAEAPPMDRGVEAPPVGHGVETASGGAGAVPGGDEAETRPALGLERGSGNYLRLENTLGPTPYLGAMANPAWFDPAKYGYSDLPAAPLRNVPGFAIDSWTPLLRQFARGAVWALPVAAVSLAVGAALGWPTATKPGSGSGGLWLVLTAAGLALAVTGAVAFAGLLAHTRGRWLAAVSVLLLVPGALLLAPLLGLVGLARPAAFRLGISPQLEAGTLGSVPGRWLGLTGMLLLLAGGLAAGAAVLVAKGLRRSDGILLLLAVLIGGAATYLGNQLLAVLAALLLLKAALGLAVSTALLTDQLPPHTPRPAPEPTGP